VHKEGFRADLLVEDSIIVELKSVEKVQSVHKKQLLTYLRLAKKPLGLLMNFKRLCLKTALPGLQIHRKGADSLVCFFALKKSDQIIHLGAL